MKTGPKSIKGILNAISEKITYIVRIGEMTEDFDQGYSIQFTTLGKMYILKPIRSITKLILGREMKRDIDVYDTRCKEDKVRSIARVYRNIIVLMSDLEKEIYKLNNLDNFELIVKEFANFKPHLSNCLVVIDKEKGSTNIEPRLWTSDKLHY